MSEPTVIDAEYEETEVTLEDRVTQLEGLVKGLLESHKNILEYFIEAMEAISEISEESSKE